MNRYISQIASTSPSNKKTEQQIQAQQLGKLRQARGQQSARPVERCRTSCKLADKGRCRPRNRQMLSDGCSRIQSPGDFTGDLKMNGIGSLQRRCLLGGIVLRAARHRLIRDLRQRNASSTNCLAMGKEGGAGHNGQLQLTFLQGKPSAWQSQI